MALGLSASTIKSWFQYRCERKTRYELMNPTERAAVPIIDDNREKPWIALGVDFEKRVIHRLAREQRLHVHFPLDEGLPTGVTNAFLRGEGSPEYAAQVNLRPLERPEFIDGVDGVELRQTFSDLIHRGIVDGRPIFTVIDIKATRATRAFHKTQVAYYALLLREILAERDISGQVAVTGEIWRIPDDGNAEGDEVQIEQFDLAPYERVVKEFVKRTLPKIAMREVSSSGDTTFFHVYFKCEQCTYLTHCLKAISPERPPETRDVSAVAGLTHESKRTLVANGIRTVGRLAQQGQGLARVDGAGWALSRRADQLIERARAMVDDEVRPGKEEQSFLMPSRTDVSLYLLADHDPVDDGLAAIGYLMVSGDTQQQWIEVLDTPSRTAEADALVRIFSRVINDLDAVDRHNAGLQKEDPTALHAHIFVYETNEASTLQNAVKRHLNDSRVRTGLLHMVRLFPPEEIIPEPEFKGMDHLPATAIRSVIEQLFAVPTSVSYDLRQVSQALERACHIEFAYWPAEAFERPFSSLLSLDISRGLRERHRDHVTVEEIEADVQSRLTATRAIAEWLRQEHAMRVEAGGRPMLRLRKQPFRFQASFNPLDAGALDILNSLEILENRAGMLETLIRLSKPANVRRDSGQALGPLRLLRVFDSRGSKMMVFRRGPEDVDVDFNRGGLGMVISDGSPESLLDPRVWSEISCSVLDPRPGDDAAHITVRITKARYQSTHFQQIVRLDDDTGWWIDQTFVDFNSGRASTYLEFLAAGDRA